MTESYNLISALKWFHLPKDALYPICWNNAPKKEAYGPHRSPEKPVQTKENHFVLFYNSMFLICKTLSLYHPRTLCAKFGWKCPSGYGEKDFKIWWMYIYDFIIISPWKRTWPFILTNLSHRCPILLCEKFVWNWPSGSQEDEFLNSSKYFCYFVIISPLGKGHGPFFYTNLNPRYRYTRVLCAKLVEISLVVLERKIKMYKVYW